jgi:hypothetical protein
MVWGGLIKRVNLLYGLDWVWGGFAPISRLIYHGKFRQLHPRGNISRDDILTSTMDL